MRPCPHGRRTTPAGPDGDSRLLAQLVLIASRSRPADRGKGPVVHDLHPLRGHSEIQRRLIGRAVTGLDVRQLDWCFTGPVPDQVTQDRSGQPVGRYSVLLSVRERLPGACNTNSFGILRFVLLNLIFMYCVPGFRWGI